MAGLPAAKIEIVRGLVEQSPDRIVSNLQSALAAVEDDTALAGVRRVVEAEVADRRLRNMALEPVAPLFAAGAAGGGTITFPPQALALLWRGLKAEAPDEVLEAAAALVDYRPDESSTEPFDALVARLIDGLEAGVQRDYLKAIDLMETDRPGSVRELLACLEIAPVVRRATLRLPEWIARTTGEGAAAAKVAYKDALASGEDAGPRFFEMLAAQLAERWMILRVVSAVMSRPAESYLAASELAVFALRLMDAIDANLKEVANFDALGGTAAGERAAALVETLTLQVAEVENNIELAHETGWGARLLKQKQTLAAVVEARLRELEKALGQALPNHRVRVARAMKMEPRLTLAPDAKAVERCRALLAFSEGVRTSAAYGGFTSTRAKVMENVAEAFDDYVDEVLSLVRDNEAPDREIAARFLQLAAEFATLIHEPRAGDLVRRRAAAAFGATRRPTSPEIEET
ncbi:MAG: hypothetical protein ACK41C_11335 [Phenylobacterium sp.]|uniref:hypothetical protein n=1 Tax=Phenylobacterium sp. TaxID=1871053 RepID=UPI00391D32FF